MAAVRYAAEASEQLKSLHIETQRILKKAIKSLGADPNLGKLLGDQLSGFRSLRVGKYRVIYSLRSQGAVLIHALGHRRDVYTLPMDS